MLLLCSDGLSGPVTADAIKLALTRSDPQAAAERLILEARKQGGPDNITAVVVRLDEGPHGAQDGSEDETTLIQPADPEAEEVTGELPFVIDAPGAEEPAGDAADALAAQAAALRAEDEGPPGARRVRRRRPPPQAHGAPARHRRGAARAARRGAGRRRLLPQHRVLRRAWTRARSPSTAACPPRSVPSRCTPCTGAATSDYDTLSPSAKTLVDEQQLRDRQGALDLGTLLGMFR